MFQSLLGSIKGGLRGRSRGHGVPQFQSLLGSIKGIHYFIHIADLLEFQSLLGSIKGAVFGGREPLDDLLFQSLLGSIKGRLWISSIRSLSISFQSLLGSIKGSDRDVFLSSQSGRNHKVVSIPARFD